MSRTKGSSAPKTRARILEAAQQLFRDRGYGDTSIRDLADALGMTTGTLYYHFASKADILDALVAPALEGLHAIAATPAEEAKNPELLLRRLLALFAEHGLAMQAVRADASARRHLLANRDLPATVAAVERVIARSGKPGDLLRARAAIGALHAGVLFTLDQRTAGGSPTKTALTGREQDIVIAAALAALTSATEKPGTNPR